MSLRRFGIGEAKGRIFRGWSDVGRKRAEFACFGGGCLIGGFVEGAGGGAHVSDDWNLRQRWHVCLGREEEDGFGREI